MNSEDFCFLHSDEFRNFKRMLGTALQESFVGKGGGLGGGS